jgi:hypothetical protein
MLYFCQIEDTTKPEIDDVQYTSCKSSSLTTCQSETWTFSASTWDTESGEIHEPSVITSVVDFTNILQADFMHAQIPKEPKRLMP